MPRSFESTARRKADKLIRQFVDTRRELLKISERLYKLRPFSRQAYFNHLIRTPEDGAQWARIFARLADDPIGEFEGAAFNLPPNATNGRVFVLLEEHIASRGWTERVRELLANGPAVTPVADTGETEATHESAATEAPVAYA